MLPAQLQEQITQAFADVERPGNYALRGSNEGEEPFLLEAEFADKGDWRSLEPAFLDQAPGGFASALSFFSDEAFRHYLPAYLIADLGGKLLSADPCFHLWHGLHDEGLTQKLNPRRFGDRTWFEACSHRMSTFTAPQAAAVVAYLRYRIAQDPFRADEIEQAIRNFWQKKAEGQR